MRKILMISAAASAILSSAAVAADLPARVPAVAPAPVFVASNWGGAYIGLTGGYTTARARFNSVLGADAFNINGGLVGGQIGYDHNLGNNLVLGVVGDLSWVSANGKLCVESNGPCADDSDSWAKGKITWFGTARAKLGYALSRDVLAYVTGGAAFAGVEARITHIAGSSDADAVSKTTRMGWTVGAGLNYRVAQNWTIGAEYLYANYGSKTQTFTGSIRGAAEARVNLDQHVIRASLNYHFGAPAAPVVAKY